MNTGLLLIRPSQAEDLPTITAIYAHAVLHSAATFEIEAPDLAEMTRRREDIVSRNFPYLVAERGGQPLGYAYAAPFRQRHGYRFCLEDSIYLDPAAQGQGLGRLLLAELLARSQRLGARQMVSVIGDSANAASIGVHRSLGFRDTGVLQAVGRKFERWFDVVLMQRALGPADLSAPSA
jgi:L-amino acid N-acyltransferase YncA